MQFYVDSDKFKTFLQETFDMRARKNPQYSLRSFARDLHLNDSTLSKLLSGKRKITAKHVEKIIAALKLPSSHVRKFKLKQASQDMDHDRIEFQQLSFDAFNAIADWFHDAILELSKNSTFRGDEKFIAKRLGINITQARLATQRLKRLGLISVDEGNMWTINCENSLLNFNDPTQTNRALKEYQVQLLELSKNSVEEVPVEKRNHTSFVLALNSALLDEVHEKMREFQKSLIEYIEIESKGCSDEVYAIQFTSFPVTKKIKS